MLQPRASPRCVHPMTFIDVPGSKRLDTERRGREGGNGDNLLEVSLVGHWKGVIALEQCWSGLDAVNVGADVRSK